MTVMNEIVVSEADWQVASVKDQDIRGNIEISREAHRLAYRVLTMVGVKSDFDSMNQVRDYITVKLEAIFADSNDDYY